MFTLKEFIKKGLIEAVAAGWLEKDVLTEADLVDVDVAIESQYKVEEVI